MIPRTNEAAEKELMRAGLAEQTRGCRTTGLFWEGQERLPEQEAEVPLCPGVCSHLWHSLPGSWERTEPVGQSPPIPRDLARRFGGCAQMGFGEVWALQEEASEEAG